MVDASRYRKGDVTADLRLDTRGLGAVLEEVLVAEGWTAAFASSGSNTMLKAPSGMGTCYMHILDFAGYAEIQIGAGASDVSTLMGNKAPGGSTKSFFRKNDSAESNTIEYGLYVGPRGDFLFFNAYGPTAGETSHLMFGHGSFDTTDPNGFFIAGTNSNSNASTSQQGLSLKAALAGKNWLNSMAADSVGENMLLSTDYDQSLPSDGGTPNPFPGTTDSYIPSIIRLGDSNNGEHRGYLGGCLSLLHAKPHTCVRNDDFDSGSHTLVMPAGSPFGASQTNVNFDAFEVKTSGAVYVTTNGAIWPQ